MIVFKAYINSTDLSNSIPFLSSNQASAFIVKITANINVFRLFHSNDLISRIDGILMDEVFVDGDFLTLSPPFFFIPDT
jgi:hypothetical protein